jgi:hypothetical protein
MYFMKKNDDDTARGVSEYICDSVEDLENLPPRCAPGSVAIVLTPGDMAIYMKSPEGKWVKL